ncbi:NAD(P)/FAD-dependent oxidoreductase [Paenibacillus sp. TRM 82003]|uniref:NAD(P)/FAD-dependent oxidoreductase n=1 Tax=Kineococcus sp. TRM81007 TaxID=2925831 RepID=UPI001F594D74|nr:FAD/NAD(P)-binding oxidoreductase [Kineococcus sp. TRM81007]MCI2239577.1 NAD(P)/FAD-dependent oxidoreductase [Kineococcus sp. TRM81007]MCI3926141.1 NAD(P)/FAD-dependent oxidoreductase [Paenibacillus sp. TRM 82003]
MADPATDPAPERVDVLVVGAGPAGLGAARAARAAGARVVLLDSSDQVGGQYWRHLPPERTSARESTLHHGWERFTALREALSTDEGCRVVTGAQVWAADRGDDGPPVVHAVVGPADGTDRTTRAYAATSVVLATGAHERTLPFPGWDLPGVFSGGAAQALAKGERVAVGRRVLVAGAGPFLLPVAASLVRTGAGVAGIVEASRWGRITRGWGTRPWELLPARTKVGELGGYLRDLAAHRIPYRAGAGVVAAHGRDRVESVTVADLDADWRPVPGTERRHDVDAVCVSHGFVPRVELALSSGCATADDGSVRVDDEQRTTVPGVFAAGEVTGIGGADLSLAEGEVAGLVAAGALPGPGLLRRRATYRAFAARLHAAHGIRPGWTQWVDDTTIVCRCEEVSAGELRRSAELTCSRGLRSLKLTTRAGLGICQGRTCGRSVEDLLERSLGPAGLLDRGRVSRRPLAAPVRMGEIARAVPPLVHLATPAPSGPVPGEESP